MVKTGDIRRQVAQRLRELFPKAKGWEELADLRAAGKPVDVAVRFRLGDAERVVAVEVSSLGQPRQIRGAVTRLTEIRRELPSAYPVAAAVYIGPQSARILKDNNLGYLDLSGNCYLRSTTSSSRRKASATSGRRRVRCARSLPHGRRGSYGCCWPSRSAPGVWRSWPRPPRSVSATRTT